MLEKQNLEFKVSTNTKTYLKTVSAFANYLDGTIEFGRADDGTIIGLENPVEAALNIENQINDRIQPRPDFMISVDERNRLVILKVKKGEDTPYYYGNQAYKRSGTSSIPVGILELNRLILRGKNQEFGDLPSESQNLTFEKLGSLWKSQYEMTLSRDILVTLGLMSTQGEYTNTALLISDQNDFPGIDFVIFGKTMDLIERRERFSQCSVLLQLENVLNMLSDLLSYERIQGMTRTMESHIPYIALRETLINAAAHRDWMINADIQISLAKDQLTILSPGGLPSGMTIDEYLDSTLSIPRNTNLTWLFKRLNLIEKLGTGIGRIKNAYKSYSQKPEFKITENSVMVRLPFVDEAYQNREELNPEQKLVVSVIREYGVVKRTLIDEKTGFSQTKSSRILRQLMKLGIVEAQGTGPKTVYKLVS